MQHLVKMRADKKILLGKKTTLKVVVNLAEEVKRMGGKRIPGTTHDKSCVMAPLIAGGEARGLIELTDPEKEYAFDDDDLRWVE